MSLSRSPSPRRNGGWTSPGMTDFSDRASSPLRKPYGEMNGYETTDVQWAAAKAKSDQIRGYPSFQTRNEGFFSRSRRKISATLPTFNSLASKNRDWRESEKLGRGRWPPDGAGRGSRLKTLMGNLLRRFKFIFILLAIAAVITLVMSRINVLGSYRRSSRFGGGSKYVIILASNEGGGVMEWKGPREWAIERDSIKNKKKYTEAWGYDLEISDMSTKKRYAHEWRESWEKVDLIRNAMAKYPDAEWFWWLDLNTFIMEPSYSLQSHIFSQLPSPSNPSPHFYRDINHYNPLGITHPPASPVLDEISRSPTGDNLTTSIDMILAQDCGGFNLGSFFVRRSAWADRLLDIWWDPVLYEQKHMEWEHKEQDALEHIYIHQPWIRSHIAFVEQRRMNSFPPGACPMFDRDGQQTGELDPRVHYREEDRDFMVNMAGCEWGRDCWAEMYQYRELSIRLNLGWWASVRQAWKDKSWRLKQQRQKEDGDEQEQS